MLLITPTKSAYYVGELVSHSDFHDGPSLLNLYDGTGYGCNMHSNVYVWMCTGRMGPTTKNLWSVHMAELCSLIVVFNIMVGRATRQAIVHHHKNVEQSKMLVWITRHLSVVYIGAWRADHTGQFWHPPLRSLAVIMWKLVGQHLFLNIFPNKQFLGWNQTQTLVWRGTNQIWGFNTVQWTRV
jgi:hypothetical protein